MKSLRLSHLVALAALALTAATGTVRAAAPLAGTPIGNQAKATYTDDSAVTREVFSNTVITTVTQVDGLTLVTDLQAKIANPGSLVYFPHTVTNTGNGTDTYTLTPGQLTGAPDTFDLTSFAIYPDANQDGLPDNYTAITTTGPLAPGAEFHVVVVGLVPPATAVGGVAKVTLTALSTLVGGSGSSVTNTDTVTVVNGAVMQVTKAVSTPSGFPGDTAIKYTITYTNTGNAAATDFKITDAVPAGLAYVTDSGRWSITAATVLTNASITTGGITYDYSVTTVGSVTATIASVPAGGSGYITFLVDAQSEVWFRDTTPTVLPKIINNTASYSFSGPTAQGPFTTNTVPFTVKQVAHVTFTGDNEPSDNATPPNELGTPGTPSTYTAPAGSTVVFRNVLKNTGTGIDTFDITINTAGSTFPAGTSFQLFQGDAQTPMVDSNGNSTPDTGPLAPNATYTVVVKAILPTNASGSAGYSVVKTATSGFDPVVTAPATDALAKITGANVDLTNSNPASGSIQGTQYPGTGLNSGDANASPVLTNVTNPGTTTIFTLNVQNTGPFSDSFSLLASNTGTFGTTSTLPAGWSVVFKKAGVSVSNTGSIATTTSQVITAEVTIPSGTAPDAFPIYFQVKSPTSSATDVIHDAIKVNVVRGLILQTDNVGQTFPGGSVVYVHTLKNTGNVTEGVATNSAIAFALTETFTGFNSVVYYDSNGDGTLTDGVDPIVTGNLSTVDAGGIAPGQTIRLFVKVTAPLGATDGTSNTTKLAVTTTNVAAGLYVTGGTYVSAAPAAVSNVDTTSVTRGDLSIDKYQALDADNDGQPDGAYVTTQLVAPPGMRIIYKIVVTNTGSANATGITVNDSIPANTTYSKVGTTTASVAQIKIGTGASTPSGDPVAGAFAFPIGTLTPAQVAVITFGVKINN